MTLRTRLLLLALGKKTDDRYEQEGARAVRAYLVAMLLRSVVLLLVHFMLGMLIFRSAWGGVALVFAPAFAFLLSLEPDMTLPNFAARNEGPKLRKMSLTLGGMHGIPEVPVYVSTEREKNAYCYPTAKIPYVVIDQDLAPSVGIPGLSGILAHELAHILLPFGGHTFEFVKYFFGWLPDFLVHFRKYPRSDARSSTYRSRTAPQCSRHPRKHLENAGQPAALPRDSRC